MSKLTNLKDNDKSKAGSQNNPKLLREFIWCSGPRRLPVVLISREREIKPQDGYI